MLDSDHCGFTVQTPNEVLNNLQLQISGKHNIENALVAIAVAQYLGIDNTKIAEALHTFTGVKRRFEYIVRTPNFVFIDDYAHHPEEINALLKSVRFCTPSTKLALFFSHICTRVLKI